MSLLEPAGLMSTNPSGACCLPLDPQVPADASARNYQHDGRGASPAAIQFHYDVGVEFYRLWLDSQLTYSAARWGCPDHPDQIASSLEVAQLAKIDFHHSALCVAPGDTVLDIGCGWGSFLSRAASHYGNRAIGLTLSVDQARYVCACGIAGTDVRLMNYEDFRPQQRLEGIVAIGSFEHIARPGLSAQARVDVYRGLFGRCHDWLVERGRLSLQTICWADTVTPALAARFAPTAIFPESDLPYQHEVLDAARPWFDLLHLENGQSDYLRTLREWLSRLRRAEPIIRRVYGDHLYIHYERYLRRSIVAFARKHNSLARFLFVRKGSMR